MAKKSTHYFLERLNRLRPSKEVKSSFSESKPLAEKGYSKKKIAEIVGCSRKTVRRALARVERGEELKRKKVLSIISPYEEIVRAKVGQGLSAVRIYQDLQRETLYSGSYGTFQRV